MRLLLGPTTRLLPTRACIVHLAPQPPPKRAPHQITPRRWNWQIVLRPVRDRSTGQMKYPDWEDVARSVGFPEPSKHNQSLLDRHLRQEEHIKPTELKRRLNSRKVYQRSVKRIEDLKKYVQFIEEHRKD